MKLIFKEKYEINEIDGIRITFKNGWALIRASNTEPVIVLRFEAKNKALLTTYEKIVYEKLSQFGVKSSQ